MNIVPHTSPDGVVRLALTGELDLATIDVLHRHVEQAISAPRTPPGLGVFCDSTGLGALLNARHAAAAYGTTVLCGQPARHDPKSHGHDRTTRCPHRHQRHLTLPEEQLT